MIKINSSKIINDVIKGNLCISCGSCVGLNPTKSLLVKKKGILLPKFSKDYDKFDDAFSICPGKGYDIVSLGAKYFGNESNYDIEIGYFKSVFASRYNNKEFEKNASSGGIMTGIANYCLTNNIVDGIITTKMVYGSGGVKTKTFIAKSREELLASQGSKYMPVPALEILQEILDFQGKLIFIGTPCQIASLKLLQAKYKELDKILFTIGNFCGGFRDFRESERLIKMHKFKLKDITFYRFRGDGQPGSMLIKDSKKEVKINYPDYAHLTGFIKYKRCKLCVDATAELADISCGDAWLPKFICDKDNWSIVISRSQIGEQLFRQMQEKSQIISRPISLQELKDSQKGNLFTKKTRQNSRIYLYNLMQQKIPIYDGGYYLNKINILQELKILVKQMILYFMELLKIYKTFAKIIGRIKV